MWSDQSRSMGSVIWGSTVIGVALLRREKEVFLKIKQNKGQRVGGWSPGYIRRTINVCYPGF